MTAPDSRRSRSFGARRDDRDARERRGARVYAVPPDDPPPFERLDVRPEPDSQHGVEPDVDRAMKSSERALNASGCSKK
jgi:hypothetical protein